MSALIPEGIKEETLKWISDNPLLAGLLAIIGFSIHERIKNLVKCVFDFIQDLLIMTDKLEAPDEAYISYCGELIGNCFTYFIKKPYYPS